MHYLTRQRLHISLFHPLMKVLMSLYILSVGAGLWVATLKYSDRAEWSSEGVELRVHGSETTSNDDALGDPFSGLDAETHEGMSRRELVDVAHPHLFSVPIVLFILGHLLHLTRIPDWLKLTINVVAFGSFFATFLLPFVVIDDATLAPALFASGCAMIVGFLALCAIPLVEMWFGKPGGSGFDAIPRRRGRGGSASPSAKRGA
jgi:hypothetical protein